MPGEKTPIEIPGKPPGETNAPATAPAMGGGAEGMRITGVPRARNPARAVTMATVDHLEFDGHAEVVAHHDPSTGLSAIIAVHTYVGGRACGGCRMAAYSTPDDALTDVLRLSKGMSYKNAMMNLPMGGAKAVIIGDPRADKSKAMLVEFARRVDGMGGRYFTAEDVDIGPDDVETMATATTYVVGRMQGPAPSGDPSPVTARGVLAGIKVCVKECFGGADLKGRSIAILGVGHVGAELARLVAGEGASLVVADIDAAKARLIAKAVGARCVEPEQLLAEKVDVFSPNARGAIINDETVGRIQARIVAGAANNQLATDNMGDALAQREILYAPDYIINAGGLINCYAELRCIVGEAKAYDPEWVNRKLLEIDTNLTEVFAIAKGTGKPPHRVADEEARRRIGARPR